MGGNWSNTERRAFIKLEDILILRIMAGCKTIFGNGMRTRFFARK